MRKYLRKVPYSKFLSVLTAFTLVTQTVLFPLSLTADLLLQPVVAQTVHPGEPGFDPSRGAPPPSPIDDGSDNNSSKSLKIIKQIVDSAGKRIHDPKAGEFCFTIVPQVDGSDTHCVSYDDNENEYSLLLTDLVPQNYTLTESGPDGYTFVGVTGECTEVDNGVASVSVGQRDTYKKCVFKNMGTSGSLKVVKDVVGPNGEDLYDESGEFDFRMGDERFTLKDGESKLINDLPAGVYTVNERDHTAGYELVSYGIDLDPSTDGAQVEVKPGQETVLLVTNRQVGATVKVFKKVLDWNGKEIRDFTNFRFTHNDSDPYTFARRNPVTLKNLMPGEHTIEEVDLPYGYKLVGYSEDSDNNLDNGAQLTLENNETVHLYVTNQKEKSVLTVTKVDSVDPVTAGDSFDYTITVTNDGPHPLNRVRILDQLFTTTPFKINSYEIDKGSCNVTNLNGAIRCVVLSLDTNETVTLKLNVKVPSDTPNDTYENTVVVTTRQYPDGISVTETTTVIGDNQLGIDKGVSKDTVVPGVDSNFYYTVTLSNDGLSNMSGVRFEDSVPTIFDLTSVVVSGSVDPNDVNCTAVENTVECDVDQLDSGEDAVFTLNVDLPAGAAEGVYTNTAYGYLLSDPENKVEDTVSVTVDRNIDVDVWKSVDKEQLVAGDPEDGVATFTLGVMNYGPSTAEDVILYDNLPAQFVYESHQITLPVNYEQLGMYCEYLPETHHVRCFLGDLSAGQEVNVDVQVSVPSSVDQGTYTNHTSAFSPSCFELNLNDLAAGERCDHAWVDVEVIEDVQLRILKSDSVDPVSVGEQFEYLLHVSNLGVSDAEDIVVADGVPSPFMIVGSYSDADDKVACAGDSESIECTITTLLPGESMLIHLEVVVKEDAQPGVYVNSAFVYSEECPFMDESDFCEGYYDEDQEETTVIDNPLLLISKSNNSAQALQPGDIVSYFITLTLENGEVTVEEDESPPLFLNPTFASVRLAATTQQLFNVQLTDLLPQGLTFIPGTGGVVDQNNNTLPIAEPDYSNGVGVWNIGNITGMVVVKYSAIINNDTTSGVYPDLAWAVGQTSTGADLLAQAMVGDPSRLTANIVGTLTSVETPSPDTGVVLGTSVVNLPVTGVRGWLTVLGLTSILLGMIVLFGKKGVQRLSGLKFHKLAIWLVGVVGTWFLLGAGDANAQLYLTTSTPKTPTSQQSVTFTYSAAAIDESVNSVSCQVKAPGQGSFATFHTTSLPNGTCPIDKNVIGKDGEYQFRVEVVTSADTYTSIPKSVQYDPSVPGTPADYEKEEVDSCTYKIKFTILSNSNATHVELHRSTSTSFTANSSTLVTKFAVTPGGSYVYDDTVPNCDLDYYHQIRTLSESGSPSPFVGDTLTTTSPVQQPVVDQAVTGDGGAPTVTTDNGDVLGEEDGDTPVSDEDDNDSDDEDERDNDQDDEATDDNQEEDEESSPSFFRRALPYLIGAVLLGALGYWVIRMRE